LASFGQAVSEEKIVLTVANQKKESSIKFLRFVPFGQQIWLPRAIFVSDWLMLNKSSPPKLLGQMEPSLAGSIYIRKKNCSWWPCLLSEWNQMKKLDRRSYIDASYQAWFNLARQFQRRRFV
jgi:hypothetical protein